MWKDLEGNDIKNGTTLAIPLQCTAIAEGVLYMHAVDIQQETKEDLGQDMLHREGINPAFNILVHENDVELSLNETQNEWQEAHRAITMQGTGFTKNFIMAHADMEEHFSNGCRIRGGSCGPGAEWM